MRSRDVRLSVLALTISLFSVAAQAAELRVMIEGVASASGTIVVGLYDRPQDYEKAVEESAKVLVNDSKRLVGVSLRAKTGTQSVVFPDLEPGQYAVVAFHDENDDSKLDKNALGMPVESYAISNNARGLLSSPDFRHAAVALDDEVKVITLNLFYPRQPGERP